MEANFIISNMILQITMAAGPGKVLSTLPEHLKAMGQRYPHPVLSSGAGRRVMNADVWNHGLKKNMPHHYKVEVPSWPNAFSYKSCIDSQEYYMQWQQGPKLHIHSKPNLANFEKDEWGEIHPVQNPRIYVVYPEIFHQGLWGGEGVVKGMLKRTDGNHRNFTPPAAKYWWPSLFEGVVHSEILGKHIDMVVTKRGVRLVDEAAGFDSYLLSTPVNEVYATGLLRLKRELLLALAQPGLLPDSVQRKYEKFRVSFEEADWHGLTMQEARLKQSRINAKIEEAKKIPDKVVFRKQLVEELREGRFEEDAEDFGEQEKNTGLLGGIKNIFGR